MKIYIPRMRFIATIAVIAFSGAIICSPDFGSPATRTANTNFVRPQSNSGSFLPIVGTQQPLKKSQIFQAATNSQQNNVTNYRVQRPSSTHLSPQSSLYPSITSRPLRSILRIGKQLRGYTGIGGIGEGKAPAAPLKPPSGICSSILIAATRMDLCG